MKRPAVALEAPLLLTGVRVALQGHEALATCAELMQTIQEFVDHPRRWSTLTIPTTPAMDLMAVPRSAERCRLATRNSKMLDRAMMLAAARGYLHIIMWLSAYFRDACSHVPVSKHVLAVAVAFGHAHVAQWLHVSRTEGCSPVAMVAACEIGRTDLLDWLFTNGLVTQCPPWTSVWLLNTMKGSKTPSSDIVAALKWLHAHSFGGQFRPTDMDTAALNGNLDIVKFLHEYCSIGCTTDAMDNAAQGGHLDIVRFLHTNRTEGCTTGAMDMAAEQGHLEIVIFLHEHRSEGCTTMSMDAAARAGHLHIVQWLHKNRQEGCTVAAMNGAIRRHCFKIVQFLYDHRTEGCSPRVLLSAVLCGKLEMVQWLHDHYPTKFSTEILQEAIVKAQQFHHTEIALWLTSKEVQLEDAVETVS